MKQTPILYLTLTREWFDAIATGKKKVEYRHKRPHWKARLEGRSYREVHFRNGYRPDSPFMRVEWCGLDEGAHFNGATCYGIKLGAVLEISNWPGPKE